MGAIAKRGDPTTTRGVVLAFNNFASNGGLSIALHGDHATCGTCGPGSWPIIGTAEYMRFHGRAAVQHGDWVACPCKKNRVIATAENMHYDHRGDRQNAQASTSASSDALTEIAQVAVYDQQFRLLNNNGSPVVGATYKIASDSGVVATGVTDMAGHTVRVTTASAETIHLYLVG